MTGDPLLLLFQYFIDVTRYDENVLSGHKIETGNMESSGVRNVYSIHLLLFHLSINFAEMETYLVGSHLPLPVCGLLWRAGVLQMEIKTK